MSETVPRVAAIVPAAGSGVRMGMGPVSKALLPLDGKPLLLHAVEALRRVEAVCEVVIVTRPEEREDIADLFPGAVVVSGAGTRQGSVLRGLEAARSDLEWVLVHDGARPLVTPAEIEAVIAAMVSHGAAVLAVPVQDTLKEGADGRVIRTVRRERLHRALTPQGFRREDLLRALRHAEATGLLVTDEAGALEILPGWEGRIALVPGSEENIKVTVPGDLRLAEALLARR